MRIGFIGLGMMGSGMAANILAAGHRLVVATNRARANAEALGARGAECVAEPVALAGRADAIVTCLADAQGVAAMIDELTPALRPGMLVVDATTSHPATSERLASALRERAVTFADAPVTGGPAQAEAGTLASLVGCAEADLGRVEAVVGPYSGTVRRFGPPGSGHRAKLINNFVTQGTAVLLAEAFAEARRAGLSLEALEAVMARGAARSGTFDKMASPAVRGDYEAHRFTIANARKDIGYYVDMAGRAAAEGTAGDILARLDAALAAGHGGRFVSQLMNPAVWETLAAPATDRES